MSLFAVAALTLASCHKDNASYDDGKNNVGDNIGYLVLGGLEATVMEDLGQFARTQEALCRGGGIREQF